MSSAIFFKFNIQRNEICFFRAAAAGRSSPVLRHPLGRASPRNVFFLHAAAAFHQGSTRRPSALDPNVRPIIAGNRGPVPKREQTRCAGAANIARWPDACAGKAAGRGPHVGIHLNPWKS